MPVNPGRHRLVGKRGADEVVVDIEVGEGERKPLTLAFETDAAAATATEPSGPVRAPASAPNAPPTARSSSGSARKGIALATLAAGGAGLVVGGVSGVLALLKRNELDDNPHCTDGKCGYAVEDEVGSLRAFRTVSTVGFIAGGALAATGIVLLLTGPSHEAQGRRAPRQLALTIAPSGVQVWGQF